MPLEYAGLEDTAAARRAALRPHRPGESHQPPPDQLRQCQAPAECYCPGDTRQERRQLPGHPGRWVPPYVNTHQEARGCRAGVGRPAGLTASRHGRFAPTDTDRRRLKPHGTTGQTVRSKTRGYKPKQSK